MSKSAQVIVSTFKKMGATDVNIAGKSIIIGFAGPAANKLANAAAQTLRGAGVGNVNIEGQTVHAFL